MTDFYYGSEYDGNRLSLDELRRRSFNDSHQFKPDFTINTLEEETGSPRTYGVELELCSRMGNRGESAFHALSILNKNRRFFYSKYDGSVSCNGYELNSHPFSLAYFEKNFTKESWDDVLNHAHYFTNQTCGYHVHISRTNFNSAESLNRFLSYLVVLRPFLLSLSNRTDIKHFNRYASFLGLSSDVRDSVQPEQFSLYTKTVLDAQRYTKRFTGSLLHEKTKLPKVEDDVLKRTVGWLKTLSGKSRYVSVNLRNSSTVELRMFAGTTDYNMITGVLYLIDHLILLSNNNRNILSLSDFENTLEPGSRVHTFFSLQFSAYIKTVRKFHTLLNNSRLILFSETVYYRVFASNLKVGDRVLRVEDGVCIRDIESDRLFNTDTFYRFYGEDIRNFNDLQTYKTNSKLGKNTIVLRPLPLFLLELVDKEKVNQVSRDYVSKLLFTQLSINEGHRNVVFSGLTSSISAPQFRNLEEVRMVDVDNEWCVPPTPTVLDNSSNYYQTATVSVETIRDNPEALYSHMLLMHREATMEHSIMDDGEVCDSIRFAEFVSMSLSQAKNLLSSMVQYNLSPSLCFMGNPDNTTLFTHIDHEVVLEIGLQDLPKFLGIYITFFMDKYPENRQQFYFVSPQNVRYNVIP